MEELPTAVSAAVEANALEKSEVIVGCSPRYYLAAALSSGGWLYVQGTEMLFGWVAREFTIGCGNITTRDGGLVWQKKRIR